MVIWSSSESDSVTEEKGVRCRGRFLREVEAAAVIARSSQKQSVLRVFVRRKRDLSEDGHAGIGVRATSNFPDIIIRFTRTHDVLLGRKGRRIRQLMSGVKRRFDFPGNSVEHFAKMAEKRAHR